MKKRNSLLMKALAFHEGEQYNMYRVHCLRIVTYSDVIKVNIVGQLV